MEIETCIGIPDAMKKLFLFGVCLQVICLLLLLGGWIYDEYRLSQMDQNPLSGFKLDFTITFPWYFYVLAVLLPILLAVMVLLTGSVAFYNKSRLAAFATRSHIKRVLFSLQLISCVWFLFLGVERLRDVYASPRSEIPFYAELLKPLLQPDNDRQTEEKLTAFTLVVTAISAGMIVAGFRAGTTGPTAQSGVRE